MIRRLGQLSFVRSTFPVTIDKRKEAAPKNETGDRRRETFFLLGCICALAGISLLSYMFFGLRLSLQLQIYVRGLAIRDHCLKSWFCPCANVIT